MVALCEKHFLLWKGIARVVLCRIFYFIQAIYFCSGSCPTISFANVATVALKYHCINGTRQYDKSTPSSTHEFSIVLLSDELLFLWTLCVAIANCSLIRCSFGSLNRFHIDITFSLGTYSEVEAITIHYRNFQALRECDGVVHDAVALWMGCIKFPNAIRLGDQYK